MVFLSFVNGNKGKKISIGMGQNLGRCELKIGAGLFQLEKIAKQCVFPQSSLSVPAFFFSQGQLFPKTLGFQPQRIKRDGLSVEVGQVLLHSAGKIRKGRASCRVTSLRGLAQPPKETDRAVTMRERESAAIRIHIPLWRMIRFT